MVTAPKSAQVEAVELTIKIVRAIEATIGGQSGTPGAQLQFTCGEFIANAAVEFSAAFPAAYSATVAALGTFWGDFTSCFDQAQLAGTTYPQFEVIRLLAEAATPISSAGAAVQNFASRMTLIEEARILAATTFVSRDQINAFIDQIGPAFDDAITVAADNVDNVAYQALIALKGAVMNDLSTRSLPLPKLVNYTIAQRLPSLYLAQRLYQDGSRNDEIVAENNIVHPAFCPLQLRVLSS